MIRLFDILMASLILILAIPILIASAIAIKVSSNGPILYRAKRVGRDCVSFDMLKFRTMHKISDGSVITAHNDPRIFRIGSILRATKIDELPQFWNVLTGDMAIVGPRPEDPKIVRAAYTDWMKETLIVRPGITSPGALYYYAFCERIISNEDPEQQYIDQILSPKLAIDRAYIDRQNLVANFAVIIRTGCAIVGRITKRSVFPADRDMMIAQKWHSTIKNLEI